MRFAVVTTALLLMTGVQAHADAMLSPEAETPAATAPTPNVAALELAPLNTTVNPLSVLPVPLTQSAAPAAAATPEPSTIVMMATGMLALFALARRRRAAALRAATAAAA
ncbi:MAG TPA: PEP-CTERM sorting domain-containing protein [Acidobacteriaceae bacterium]|nr:PEP-CTERM sorting domain-containing protein [Acidobacteriaceae bacterium]